MPVGTDDEVARSLREMAGQYAERLMASARVERSYGAGEGVRFRPVRPGAAEVGWLDLGDSIAVFAGPQIQLRLPRRPEHVEQVRLICDAVISGRGGSVPGPARSQISVRLPDGRTVRLTTTRRSVKQVRVRRWTRRTAYLPYE